MADQTYGGNSLAVAENPPTQTSTRREFTMQPHTPRSQTPGRTQTLARNSRGTLSRLPECGGDDGEGRLHDRQADTGAETADGDHER
ncbi:hypothetical protein HO133_009878 [Letharia lupina]|uniref:Uncharacterized protein n=1 Tax=Letharia lupina TaxID=560253 RepID=A0A8H6FF67_9LECA|nr:uncharacterized protein HO133_009878 [Letharia lupina]KAF6225876.1 hypothetical protein HO133_009878 [Letharia lupina]